MVKAAVLAAGAAGLIVAVGALETDAGLVVLAAGGGALVAAVCVGAGADFGFGRW